MRISAGCRIAYDCLQPTPMLLMVSPHPSREADLIGAHEVQFDPPIPWHHYTDSFGNVCTRIVAPPGRLTLTTRLLAEDSGEVDAVVPDAFQHRVEDLPDDILVYLLGSRYCDTDTLSDIAWALFGQGPTGWGRVQAICDYVPRTERGVQEPTRTLRLGSGTCRDFAVFMIEALRSLGLAARFVSGYIYVPQKSGSLGGGATHAWLRVYVPGAGWVELDPTNGIIGNRDLIRVGIARDHRHVLPLHGTWSGGPGDSLGMSVEVDVTASGASA